METKEMAFWAAWLLIAIAVYLYLESRIAKKKKKIREALEELKRLEKLEGDFKAHMIRARLFSSFGQTAWLEGDFVTCGDWTRKSCEEWKKATDILKQIQDADSKD